MNNVSKTLYIPLYGKAYVSRKGIILNDPKAEYIWEKEGFALRGKSRSKWLAYYMGMRSSVFDRWAAEQLAANQNAVVIHIGCGMDSRCERVNIPETALWFDADFPEVIEERRRYYSETPSYSMIAADARRTDWLEQLPADRTAVVIMEGISMYLESDSLKELLAAMAGHFEGVKLLIDCYTSFAAKASKYKNPINDVGVTNVFGIDDPELLAGGTGLKFTSEHTMTPDDMISQLSPGERGIFRKLYAGGMAKKLYRMYEYTT